MAYAEFTYYLNTFGGKKIISEDEWAAYERKARRLVDMYTFDRLKSENDYPDHVKDCICELTDEMKRFDLLTEKYGKVVVSESNDGVSRTYSAEDLTEERLRTNLYRIVYMYLASSGLMYRGM